MRDFFDRWFYRLAGLVIAIVLGYYAYRFYDRHARIADHLDRRLPWIFHGGQKDLIFWGWVLGLGTAGALILLQARRTLRSNHEASPGDVGSDGEALNRSISAPEGVLPADPTYLFLGPSSEAIADLFLAAGLDARGAVVLAEAPVRAVVVNVARLREQGQGIEELCRSLAERNPEAPPLRGVFVVIPSELAFQPLPADWTRDLASELRAIGRRLRLAPPAYLTLTGLERCPGFTDLAARMGGRQAAWGVSLPAGIGAEVGEPGRTLGRYWEQVRRKTFDAMAKTFEDRSGNGLLFNASQHLRSLHGPILELCGELFGSGPSAPIPLRGIDLAATGRLPDQQSGVLYAIFGRIAMEPVPTNWTPIALAQDRSARRRAWRAAGLLGVMIAATWAYIVLGIGSLGAPGIAGLAALGVAWTWALIAMARRWPDAGSATPTPPPARKIGRISPGG